MKRSLLLAQCLATPWALMPETLQAMAGILRRWQAGGDIPEDTRQRIAADQSVRAIRAQSNGSAGGGLIAVLPLYGVEELATQILAARAQKPVVAVANSLAASAAYWIGSAASEFYCTPGGEVGSIGVWQAHEDISDALKYEGIDVTLISAGKYKVEGNPYQPLTEEAQAFLQSRVDEYYSAFVAAVAQARAVTTDTVTQGMGQGRVVGATVAQSLHMIDGVMTFDQVVETMQEKSRSRSNGNSRGSRLAQAKNALALF